MLRRLERMMSMRALFLVLFAATAACSSSSSSSSGSAPSDAGTKDAATSSTCGHPGDVGNALGVGKYCEKKTECDGTPGAPFCSIVGDPTTHFCTKLCDADASVEAQCGSADMVCACNTGGCGCTPKIC